MSSKHVNQGRTLSLTVDNLLESKRLALAVEFFNEDPARLRAILIELANETARVQKQTCTAAYSKHLGLESSQMKSLLKSQDIGPTFNIYWGLSPAEQMLYSIDPKCKLKRHDRFILLDQVKKELMEAPQDELSPIEE